MKNKELKQQMLIDGTYTKIRKYNSQLIKKGSSINNEIYQIMYNDLLNELYYDRKTEINNNKAIKKMAIEILSRRIGVFSDELECFMEMQKVKKQTRKHIDNEIYKGLDFGYSLVFSTLTFNDNSINNLTEETRRRYVIRYLKQFSGYIANIDYGKINEREHYHAVIFINPINNDKFIQSHHGQHKLFIDNFDDVMGTKNFKYGHVNYRLVPTTNKLDDDFKAISNYIAKLKNHALKVKSKKILFCTNKLVNLKQFNEFKNEQIEIKFY